MSYPHWPSFALPYQPLNADYAVQLPDLVMRSDFEQGLARQRQVFTSGAPIFAVTWPMSPLQLKLFNGWRKNSVTGECGWFLIPVFWEDAYVERKARFVKNSIAITREGGEWIVKAQLELEEVPTLSDTDTALAMLSYGTNQTTDQLADQLHTLVHTNLVAAVS